MEVQLPIYYKNGFRAKGKPTATVKAGSILHLGFFRYGHKVAKVTKTRLYFEPADGENCEFCWLYHAGLTFTKGVDQE